MALGRRKPKEQRVVVVPERVRSRNLERSRKRREEQRPYRYTPIEDYVDGGYDREGGY